MKKIAPMDLLIEPRLYADEAEVLAFQIQSQGFAPNDARESRNYNRVVTAGAGVAMSILPIPTSRGTATKLLEALLHRF
jgi:hypothetical protein